MADLETTNEVVADEVSIDDLKAQIAQLTSDNERLKKATTNASADASKYKKELQARMSAQERKDQADEDE